MSNMTRDQQILHCKDCRVWDPENQPSVLRAFELNPDAFRNRRLLMVDSGMKLTLSPGFTIPIFTEMLLCEKHQKEAEALEQREGT